MLAEQMVERVMEDVGGSGGPLTGLDAELTHALQERVRATALGASRGDVATSNEPRTYGHVVVDEAQELSTMAWRMLRRRCPRRSFTIVGDLDQAGAPGAARSWDEVFAALDHPDGTVVRFNVNYRTPGPVMALAAAVVGSDVRSAREGGEPARIVAAGDDVAATVLAEVERLEAADPGQVAVVAPAALVPAVAERLGVPAATADIGGARRIVLDPRRAKGLEFDSVVVVDPAAIAASGASGRRDLYVSLTRTTDRLTVVGALPSA
jgi:DNA helicase IV